MFSPCVNQWQYSLHILGDLVGRKFYVGPEVHVHSCQAGTLDSLLSNFNGQLSVTILVSLWPFRKSGNCTVCTPGACLDTLITLDLVSS